MVSETEQTKVRKRGGASIFQRVAVWFALVGYWLLIFVGTHLPEGPEPPFFEINDKVLHAGAFTVLSFLILWVSSFHRSLSAVRVVLILTLVAAYGTFDEWSQQFAGRTTDPADFAADMAGGMIGVGLFCLFWALWLGDRIRPSHAAVAKKSIG